MDTVETRVFCLGDFNDEWGWWALLRKATAYCLGDLASLN
jgi:hypothetical protein